MLFTRALARRLDATQVTTACLHPGVVATAIGDRAGAIAGFGWRLIKPFLISPERGAATSLFLAAVPDPTPFHGAYVVGKRIADRMPRRATTGSRKNCGPKAPASSGCPSQRRLALSGGPPST